MLSKPDFRAGALAAGMVLAASACSGGGASGGSTAGLMPAPAASATPVSQAGSLPVLQSVPDSCSDCWPTLAHDFDRTGFQPDQTGITSATVARLATRWTYEIGEQVTSSPVIANGILYVVTGAGSVIAFDDLRGSVLWRRELGAAITMTPTVDEGVLFVGTHNAPGRLFALDARSGSTRWQTSFVGAIRSAPAIASGMLIIGEAGGDPGMCYQGGVHAFEELTGTPVWTWLVNPLPKDGGSVWSPIGFGGADLVFGTGNGCSTNIKKANSMVRLTLAGAQEWQIPLQINSYVDDDWGGSATISRNRFYACNKNGYLYAVDGASGAIIWKQQISPLDGAGSIGNPATDGTTLVVPTGFLSELSPAQFAYGQLIGFDTSGNRLWSASVNDFIHFGASITNDVTFAGLDGVLTALNLKTGAVLWSYAVAPGRIIEASPAIVSAGVYSVDTSGGVAAFALGTEPERHLRATATGGPLREPYGPIIRRSPAGIWNAVY